MTKGPVYEHIENIPAMDTTDSVCAFWRVYYRDDVCGYRVELAYGNINELLDPKKATARARWAVDVRKLDLGFSADSVRALQEETKKRWAPKAPELPDPPDLLATVARIAGLVDSTFEGQEGESFQEAAESIEQYGAAPETPSDEEEEDPPPVVSLWKRIRRR